MCIIFFLSFLTPTALVVLLFVVPFSRFRIEFLTLITDYLTRYSKRYLYSWNIAYSFLKPVGGYLFLNDRNAKDSNNHQFYEKHLYWVIAWYNCQYSFFLLLNFRCKYKFLLKKERMKTTLMVCFVWLNTLELLLCNLYLE